MSINKSILRIALPSILANITVPIVGMVDMAVAGHLDVVSATAIGGVTVGSMLFDLLYWNFGFLRIGTGGLAAQACGGGDRKECAKILSRGVGLALVISAVLLAVQWIFMKGAFFFVDCTPDVQHLASEYFLIRIWAAPATLSLMAFKGWFIGMQDSVSAMITDLVVNGLNILLSIVLALGLNVGGSTLIEPMGFPGIALGTVIAQWGGLLSAALILLWKYGRNTMSLLTKDDLRSLFHGPQTRRFFVMNADLFVRSACMIVVYIGFTALSASQGDLLLAVSSILMKILMLFSYFTDGFAYAGEALTGRFIGAGDNHGVRQTIKWTFVWSMCIAAVFMLIYQFAGIEIIKVLTDDPSVINASGEFLPWLLLMPVVGCAAFTWDGIYIGATASRLMRNSTIGALVAFVAVWWLGTWVLGICLPSDSECYSSLTIHVLMAAYFAHLLVRTAYLTIKARKAVPQAF